MVLKWMPDEITKGKNENETTHMKLLTSVIDNIYTYINDLIHSNLFVCFSPNWNERLFIEKENKEQKKTLHASIIRKTDQLQTYCKKEDLLCVYWTMDMKDSHHLPRNYYVFYLHAFVNSQYHKQNMFFRFFFSLYVSLMFCLFLFEI